MTDKDKIREEVEKLKSNLIYGACSSQIAMETMCKEEAYNEVLAILDTMQEEPKHKFNVGDKVQSVSGKIAKIESVGTDKYWCIGERGMSIPFKYQDQWELVEEPKQCMYSRDNYTEEDRKVLCEGCEEKCEFNQVKESAILQHKEETCKENGDSLTQEPVSEDLEEAAYHNCIDRLSKESIEDFKAGAKWQKAKYESTTEDLGDYINELSKQFPEVSFAKLSRIAVRVAKWQKTKEYTCYEEAFEDGAKWKVENLWKPADDDLPEYDREVIVLIKYSTQRNIHDEEYPTYRVGFGHRPNPDGWDGKNIDTNEVTHYTPKLYDKGGWNAPDIVYWLDIELPKEIKL